MSVVTGMDTWTRWVRKKRCACINYGQSSLMVHTCTGIDADAPEIKNAQSIPRWRQLDVGMDVRQELKGQRIQILPLGGGVDREVSVVCVDGVDGNPIRKSPGDWI